MHNTDPQPLDASTLAHLQSWTGRTETQEDLITAAPLAGLAATLDRDDPPPADGDTVPPLGHWLSFLPRHRHSELGPDGHPQRGGFLPPVPLPRRMWAGGRLAWRADNPLRVGQRVTRQSRIASVSHKTGRSGDLVFVEVEHEFHNALGLALTETHDIVYRQAPRPGDPVPPPQMAGPAGTWQRELLPDAVMLFRYSALTFNGHRIHYDRSYATQEEGYPGLVVHGPLSATLLVDMARRALPDRTVAAFSFKAVRPCFDGRLLRLHAQPAEDGQSVAVWGEDPEGCVTLQGTLQLA